MGISRNIICLIITVAFTILTVIEGAIIKDYPAMFATGICAVIFLASWMQGEFVHG